VTEDLPHEILQARVKLMLSEPYLASAIARFPVINAARMGWCDTMATDGYYIYVNPGYCASLPNEEISFVFAHEVMHCVLGHIDRRGQRHHDLWNQAIDYATNLMLVELGLKMPKVGLLDRVFRGMTAEQIYERLAKQSKQDTSKDVVGKFQSSSGAGDEQSSTPDGGAEVPASAPKGWDLHIAPNDLRGLSARAREFPSADERKRMRIAITRVMSDKLCGTAAGLFESEIQQARGSQIPWRNLVSRFFTGLRRDDYRLIPPNKKHIWRGIYLPSMGAPGPNHIVVAVDTSGSMSDRELGTILGELDKLRSATECRLTLIQCDAKIQKVEEFDEYSSTRLDRFKFLGGGGTRFEPVFDWIRDQFRQGMFQLDALIYLTDGFGSFPPKPPPYPVLWIMTSHSRPDVPFGEVIRIDRPRFSNAS
jgi:predicted metal-dependent peptidase